MKVLFVSPYPPMRDGIGDYTRALARGVGQVGHEISVVVPRAPADVSDVIGSISWNLRRRRALLDSVMSWQPDIVHVQFALAAFEGKTALLPMWLKSVRRSLRTPVIVTMHEVTRDLPMLRAAGRTIYRQIANRADKVIVHTERARRILLGLGIPPDRVVVIPHPAAKPPAELTCADELRASVGLSDSSLLLAFGFIHVDKGLDDLVDALAILRESGVLERHDMRLVVAGAVRPRHGIFKVLELRDMAHIRKVLYRARRRHVLSHMVMTGYVPESDVAGWFRAADAVVLPYRRIEQSGVAAIACALGVPVLATRAGGLSEQLAGSEWSFPVRDASRLADVLTEFFNLPHEERVMASRDIVPSDVRTAVEATVQTYAGAIGDASRGPVRVG